MALGLESTGSVSSLFSLNAMRINNLTLGRTAAQISSGQRITSAAIDPSGIAISQSFLSRIGGLNQSLYNAQDTVNLTRTADSSLSSQGNILARMRDLAVRGANEATLSASDRNNLNAEFQSLKAELTRTGQASTYNTKNLTTDVAGAQFGTQTAQVGPDSGATSQIDVTINPSTAATVGVGASDISTTAGAQNAIDEVSGAIDNVSSQRAALGVTEIRLNHTINDLSNQNINLAEANSKIADTDIAATITERNAALLRGQLGIAMLKQSNAQAMGVLNLLGS